MTIMRVSEAQADLRRAYADGGPGAVVSGLVWTAAAVVQAREGVGTAFAVLFFGGMLIFPIGLLVCRTVLGRTPEAPDNPFGKLVMESTVAMIGALFAAWLFLRHDPGLVMPLAALAVGTHYFAFRTAYGLTIYWVLGALLVLMSLGTVFGFLPLGGWLVAAVAVVEIVFGLFLTARARPHRQ